MSATITYPKTAKLAHVDDYFGTQVADPYRWLEDDTASAVKAWVAEQNQVTFDYLARVPFRDRLRARLEELYNYPKTSAPVRTGPYYTFLKNDGLQNQAVLYLQQGLDGPPEVLLDPNTLSTDGTVRLGAAALSRDGRCFGYGLSTGGSDWLELRIMETANRRELLDKIEWVKFSDIGWHGNGFFYSRYPAPDDATSALSGPNEHHHVYYHQLGTSQADDALVYSDPTHPKRFHFTTVTEDERYLILNVSDRAEAGNDGNEIWVRDLREADGVFRRVIAGFEDTHSVIDNVGDKLLVQTNRGAPNWRVVAIDPAQPEDAAWREILPEQAEPLEMATSAGGRLFATYLEDVTHRVYVYSHAGQLEREISLPALGTIGAVEGRADDDEVFFTFSSFTYPPTTFRYDIAAGTASTYRKTAVPFDPDQFVTRQVFVPSKDGTNVPMFIVHQKGMNLDGQRPTLLYAYGGFNVTLGPTFSPLQVALLEQGGVFAVANLRGGAEYGETWHRAGMLLQKQNVFDDFIATAEWLQSNGYTSKERTAMQGGSNGGLLVGAVMTQRPDLCKVALPEVGVLDMLRYHKFTIGWNWAAEYGSSDDPVHFENLLSYSPLHNLRDGTAYPATLISTADHDDRVVPAHSFKFAAALQEKHGGDNPVLIRVETKSGHGAVSTSKRLDEAADRLAFMLVNMGIVPQYSSPPQP